MKKDIKVIISTFGPLHLIKSAEFLSKLVDITVVQGWIPSIWNRWLLKPISIIIGYNISKTIKKRTPMVLKNNKGIGLAEFYRWGTKFLFKKNNKLLEFSEVSALKIYAFLSIFYIKKVDILHVRSGSGQLAIIYAKAHGIKVLVDHSIAHPIFMEQNLKDEYLKNEVPFNMGTSSKYWKAIISDCSKADRILVNSNFVKNTFINAGFNQDIIDVVYLGVRRDFCYLKHNYQIVNKITILFTGAFSFRKGAEYSLQAMQKLESLNYNFEFIVVGNYSQAKGLISKYPIKGLKLVGMLPQDELKEYLINSDIYLFPSLCEGCASSGMEALAAGLPVIATIESGLPIINGENGIIIDSKNVDDIVNSIIILVNNPILRENLGKAASKLIANNFSWEQYADKVKSIYDNMLK